LFADLHLHTTESDGTWTPAELVREARKAGLAAVAVTDHDTTEGIEAAQKAAPEDLQVIPGIELGASSPRGDEVHVVGLWIDPGYGPLQERLAVLRQERIARIVRILDRLADLGIFLSEADVQEFSHRDVLSRSHIASAMVKKGIVQTKKEAFDAYIGQGAPAYVKRPKLTPEQAVELILGAGGVPVLAHPGLLKDLSILPSMVQAGLIGLETVHHSHSPEQEEYFLGLAAELGLLPSGGSDCHGPGGKDEIYLGKYKVPWKWLADLAKKREGSQ
jgi:predicted metal-dependent phosphoesterase TrpH